MLFVLTGIGSSNSFAFSPATSIDLEEEILQQAHHNLPFFCEEIGGTLLLQIVPGKQLGNQGKIIAFITPKASALEVEDNKEPSVYLQLQKLLLKKHIFPFHFFW
jgi:hypothetical protein